MDYSDQDYIEHCLNGRPDDFRFLIQRYQAMLSGYMTGRLGNRSLAEEAVQETFVRAYFNLKKLKKTQSFSAWLLGIAHHVIQKQIYQEQRQHRAVQITAGQAQTAEFSTDYALEQAVAKLPEHYRQVILLRYYGECSCKEVAQELQIPLGTVTKTLSRAHALMREYLTRDQNEENSE